MHDPLIVLDDPNRADFSVHELALPGDVSAERLSGRRKLLATLDRQLGQLADTPAMGRLDTFQRCAYAMVTTREAHQAFDLAQVPETLRDRSGRNIPGQRLLLARRLIEAGVRFVSVYWAGLLNTPDDY